MLSLQGLSVYASVDSGFKALEVYGALRLRNLTSHTGCMAFSTAIYGFPSTLTGDLRCF